MFKKLTIAFFAAATLAAAASAPGAALCAEFQAQRLSFMASLPTWRAFGLGWARRLCARPPPSAMSARAPSNSYLMRTASFIFSR